jgi:uncharacterized protein YfbU (UPF0304 family)
MARLELTNIERLLLANQYEILCTLKSDESYSRMAENLRSGHKWLYEQHAVRISDNLPESETEHVLSILGIYSDLRDSYDRLTDKSGIDEHLVKFPGFDGNNEAELLLFARALSQNGNYAETIGKDAKNSHMPTTAMYQRMIVEWKNLGEPRFPISRENILRITGARTHPDSRE